MASATLTPYIDNTTQASFGLASTSNDGAKWMCSGRDISLPYTVDIQRKLSGGTSTKNDHVLLRVARTERNATTGKLATAQILVDISIPKDSTVLTADVLTELCSVVSSIFNESTAMEATNVAITSLIEGRDL